MNDKTALADKLEKMKDLVLHPKRWGKREITVAVVLLFMLAGISMLAVRGYSHQRVGRLMDLGNRYIEGMEFAQAEATFDEVLTIEPRNVEAYLGLFEVYARQKRFDEALEIATRGYEATGDARLQEKITMIESGQIYDSLGKKLKMTMFSDSGYMQWFHEYSYNSKGQLAAVTHKNVVGRALGQVDLKYDEEGNELIRYGSNTKTGILFKVICEYENGQNTRSTFMELDGTIKSDERLRYDPDGNLMERHREILEGEDVGEYRYSYSYDEDDNCVRWDIYDNRENEIAYTTFSYDSEGRKRSQRWYSVKSESDSGNEEDDFYLKWRMEYEYDEEGTPVRETDYDGEGRVTGTYDFFNPKMSGDDIN